MIDGANHTISENVCSPTLFALTTSKRRGRGDAGAQHAPHVLEPPVHRVGWRRQPISEVPATSEQADDGERREELIAGAQPVGRRRNARCREERGQPKVPGMTNEVVRVFARSTRTPLDTFVAVRIATKNRNAPASRPRGVGSVTHRVPASSRAVIDTRVMPAHEDPAGASMGHPSLPGHERDRHRQQERRAAGDVQIEQ